MAQEYNVKMSLRMDGGSGGPVASRGSPVSASGNDAGAEKASKGIGKAVGDTVGKSVSRIGSQFMSIAGPLAIIAAAIAMLQNLIEPIVRILQIMLYVVFMPLIMLLMMILRPVLLLFLKWFDKIGIIPKADLKEIAEGASKGLDTVVGAATGKDDVGMFEPMKNWIEGIKTQADNLKDADGNITGFGNVLVFITGILTVFVVIIQLLIIPGRLLIEMFNFLVSAAEKSWAKLKELPELISKLWDDFKEMMANLWVSIKELPGKLLDIIKEKFESFKNVFNMIWDEHIGPAFESFKELPAKIWDKMLIAWDWFKELPDKIWNKMLMAWNWFKELPDKIWDIMKLGWDWFKNIGTTIWDYIKSGFNTLIDNLVELANKVIFWKNIKPESFGGTIAQTGAYFLHAGETVSTANQSSGGGSENFNITINASGGMDRSNINSMAEELVREIKRRITW
jgi:hypothetical protein